MNDTSSVTPEATTAPTATPPVQRPSHIRVKWEGEHLFDTGKANGPTARFDGTGKTAQTPPDALLSALASCSGVDVVDYLAKRRTPVSALSIDVQADRREQHPRKFEKIRLRFEVDGAGIDRTHAERAVQLAFERYCSVASSLAPDIEISAVMVLNGDDGATMKIG